MKTIQKISPTNASAPPATSKRLHHIGFASTALSIVMLVTFTGFFQPTLSRAQTSVDPAGPDIGSPPHAEPEPAFNNADLQSASTTELTDNAERLQRAIADGRLLPPDIDNAMSLATARLEQYPDDKSARRIVESIVAIQKERAADLLDKRRPLEAWSLANQLYGAFIEYEENPGRSPHVDWLHKFLPEIVLWRLRLEPGVTEGLADACEQAINRRHLSVAPDDKKPAATYLRTLASILGNDHENVSRLGEKINSAYRQLVDNLISERRHLEALRYVERMEQVAGEFALDQAEAARLRSVIETKQAEFVRYQELLQLADHFRAEGQLIRPKGANALEFMTEAIKLDMRPSETDEILRNLIWESRGQIDEVIQEGRLDDAAGELEHLSKALDETGLPRPASLSKRFLSEAIALKQQVEREKQEELEKQQRLEAELQRLRALEEKQASTEKEKASEPMTFVNPF